MANGGFLQPNIKEKGKNPVGKKTLIPKPRMVEENWQNRPGKNLHNHRGKEGVWEKKIN